MVSNFCSRNVVRWGQSTPNCCNVGDCDGLSIVRTAMAAMPLDLVMMGLLDQQLLKPLLDRFIPKQVIRKGYCLITEKNRLP